MSARDWVSFGMGIVFNSMLAHKVTPVTKGKRISLTYWAIGPNWK
jgi:predicted 2-oxoglutarate/Fe(II)-dependent dioxygenase YbiX